MAKVYKVMSKLLVFLPDKWNNKDVQGAILGVISVSILGGATWQVGPYIWGWLSRYWA